MSAKYKSPSFLLPNELNTNTNPLNTDGNPATGTGINSLYSMDFDSTTRIPNITGLGLGTSVDTFSISLWFYKSNMNYSILFSAYSGSGSYFQTGVSIELNTNGTIMFFNGAARTTTSAQYSANTWYNLVVTSDGTTVKMYVNGSQVTLDSTTAQARNFTNVWINSAAYSSNNFGITGKIDEVAIFNRALNTTEIAALYGGTSPNIYPSNLMATDLNPLAYYPLGEQAQMQGYLGNEASSEWQFPNGVLQDYVMDFDGGSVTTPSTYSGLDGANKLTISFWVKSTSAVTSVPLRIGTSPNRQIYITIQSSGRIVFRKNENGDNTYLRADSGTPHDGNWNHILISMDLTASSRGGIYFNGNNITYLSTLDTNAIQTSTGSLLVGDSANFVGNIAQLAIWSGTDLRNDVATIYNNGSPNDLNNNGLTAPTTWWKLNADSVYTPSAPNYTTALDFDSSQSDYIDLGNITALNNLSSFSSSSWFKTSNVSTAPIILNGGSSISNRFYLQLLSGTTIRYVIGSSVIGTSVSNVADGNWHHIATTQNGTSLDIYLDGAKQNASTITVVSPSANIGDNFKIGRYFLSATNYFDGQISNAVIFNSALSASQISTLFNFGTPETNISFSPTAWWKLDNTTTGIQDSSGNGNNGTNNGATDISSGVAVTPSWKIPDASGTSNGVSTTLPSTALQQSDLQFDSPYSNYSLSFDGTGDYIDFGNVDSIKLGDGDFTFSTWINPNSWSSSFEALYTCLASNGVWIGIDGTNFVLRIVNGSNIIAYSTLPTVNTWTHICITRVSGSCTLYYDSSPVSTATSTHNFNVDANVNLGGYGTYGNFNGKIDETSIFNYGLTSAQVLEIYNNGRPNDLTTFSGTAPISWWRLGENAYFDNNSFVVPNSISGAPNGTGSGSITTMISADAPGTYANGIGTNLDILDRVGDAPLSTSNSQSYNMIPDDKVPYVPKYVGLQTDNIYSMSFNGTDEYFNTPQIDLGSTNSISFWINRTSTAQGTLFGDPNGSSDYSLFIIPSTNNIYFRLGNNDSGYWQLTVSSGLLNDGDWHHHCLTRNSVTLSYYIDGVLQTNVVNNTLNASAGTNTTIENIMAKPDGTLPLSGKLDEVAIFDKALTADQIKFDLYQPSLPAGTNQTADIANNPNLPTPVAWYRMGD